MSGLTPDELKVALALAIAQAREAATYWGELRASGLSEGAATQVTVGYITAQAITKANVKPPEDPWRPPA